MATRDEAVEIPVDGRTIPGTVVAPAAAIPGMLFVQGWGSSQDVYLPRARQIAALGPPEQARLAVEQARVYDAAATGCFAGMFASRRNYDVARGVDAEGRRRSGVLEQSWRIGGASGAEVAALEAFRAEPGLRVVRAATVELYGPDVPPPPAHATCLVPG